MKKVLVLEGGFNEEHEVSLRTSKEVQKSLKRMKLKFEVLKVNPKNFSEKIKLYDKNFLCFNALHGTYGEDGTIQKILEKNKLSYTHSDSKASKLGFDKNLTKLKIKNSEVATLESIILERNQIKINLLYEIYNKLNSFVLKPVSSGSSFGVKIFNSKSDISKFFLNYDNEINRYKNHNKLMIEKYIQGRELTVSVYENEKTTQAVEVTEIFSSRSFFDYKAKYTKGLSKHILPAKLPKKMYKQCLSFAMIVHDKLRCKGISRSDFLYDEKNIYFLEINTQPGLTPISLVPEQLSHKNIDFDTLIKRIIESSL